MTLAQRQRPYKALTVVHLPFIEKTFQPGAEIPVEDLLAAEQTDDDIAELIQWGSIGEADDEIHPQNIIPDPDMPTMARVVQDAKRAIEFYESIGAEIPKELRKVAELDIEHVVAAQQGGVIERGQRNGD